MEIESPTNLEQVVEKKKSSKNPFEEAIIKIWKRERTPYEVAIHFVNALALMIVGYFVFTYITIQTITTGLHEINSDILYYILGGFIAQMIDGALGMAYGVTASTFLANVGVSPAVISMSVHASEIFTSGVSGYMHLKFGNVNSKLFKAVLIPGVIGAVLGAYALSTLAESYMQYVKPAVSTYTLILGVVIIQKALVKRQQKKNIKMIGPLAWFGGMMDSIGGGGWGPIVSSTLIASGRHPKYTIGSVNLAEFFISLSSSLTFIFVIGFSQWQVILGLILGGIVAAPIAARLSSKLPVKALMIMVGIVVILASLKKLIG
ncbi:MULTISPECIES: sulfite exporter TauE/SafE family protein [unclassified Arcicella]|uniref:sulfite exporter TauE/SafE family protein n=1 Tax=unclassified Arcicella TaxID=2644986 RepID=UPI002857E140|nr:MULTISPECIES: sulfite exporter TauE/SafE family protein [unclassified Arcicella]MDR6559940.1 putative membrane protein YfcA [Arcicella sp. BE51]MDR6810453.1 putative membrane protein YfcA [Arcicella sp. BE140]MDR6821803.1 putative membrane protein YfcA [Arcicella sp. BE139]